MITSFPAGAFSPVGSCDDGGVDGGDGGDGDDGDDGNDGDDGGAGGVSGAVAGVGGVVVVFPSSGVAAGRLQFV